MNMQIQIYANKKDFRDYHTRKPFFINNKCSINVVSKTFSIGNLVFQLAISLANFLDSTMRQQRTRSLDYFFH